MDPILRAGEIAHVEVVAHRGDQLLYKRGGLWANDVGAEELAGGPVGHELADAR